MTKKKQIQIIILLSLSIMGIYGFPNMKTAFYNIIKGAFALSDIKLSRIWSIYGLVTLFSYIWGGYVTDRLSPKKIIVTALSVSGVLHLYLSFVPGYTSLLVVSGMMGLTTVFAFFPAASKILSTLDKNRDTGGIFGLYYALEGVGNTLLNLAGTGFYMLTEDGARTFVYMMRAYTVLNLLSALLIFFLLKDKDSVMNSGNKISLHQLSEVVKRKEVWLIAVITMSTYVLYCGFTYLNPYLKDIYHISEGTNLLFAVIRVDVIAILAGIIFGKLCDGRGSVDYVIQKGLILSGVCILLIFVNQFVIGSTIIAVGLTMLFSFLGIGVKTISIAMTAQQRFPVAMLGSIIGLVSFIGYSPDTFLYPVVGKLLTGFGANGYLYMFILYFAIVTIGIICSGFLRGKKIKNKKSVDSKMEKKI